MKHDDFRTLDIADVVGRVLDFCAAKTNSKSAHWISKAGLDRVQESNPDHWHYVFDGTDMLGNHVINRQEKLDLFVLFQHWRAITEIYPNRSTAQLGPHVLPSAEPPSFTLPLYHEGKLLGMILLLGLKVTNPVQLLRKLAPVQEVAAKYIEFAYQNLDARSLSYIDEVTGLYNQRYLPAVLDHEVERVRRSKEHFCLLFLDIDYFKMVNDSRGHWVGSHLLKELAVVLKAQIRTCDYAFRYGGDEFIVLLGGANVENAKKVAERIRTAIEQHIFQVEGHELKLTVSIGLAGYPDHAQNAVTLIQLADQAMYYGKRKSRNIVFIAS